MLGKEKFSPQGFVFTVKGFWVKSGSGVTAVLQKYHAGLLELEGEWGNSPPRPLQILSYTVNVNM